MPVRSPAPPAPLPPAELKADRVCEQSDQKVSQRGGQMKTTPHHPLEGGQVEPSGDIITKHCSDSTAQTQLLAPSVISVGLVCSARDR